MHGNFSKYADKLYWEENGDDKSYSVEVNFIDSVRGFVLQRKRERQVYFGRIQQNLRDVLSERRRPAERSGHHGWDDWRRPLWSYPNRPLNVHIYTT